MAHLLKTQFQLLPLYSLTISKSDYTMDIKKQTLELVNLLPVKGTVLIALENCLSTEDSKIFSYVFSYSVAHQRASGK